MPECRPRAELIQELAEACILRHLRAAGKALPVFSPRKRARKRTWGWLHLSRAPSTDLAALQSCPCSFSNAEEMDELSSGTSSVVTTRQSCQGGGRVSSLQPAVCFLQAHRGHRYTRVGHAHKGPAEKKSWKRRCLHAQVLWAQQGCSQQGLKQCQSPAGLQLCCWGLPSPQSWPWNCWAIASNGAVPENSTLTRAVLEGEWHRHYGVIFLYQR